MAISHWCSVLGLVGLLAACSRSDNGLENIEEGLRSRDERDRTSAASRLADRCCPLRLSAKPDPPLDRVACDRLQTLLVTSQDPHVLAGVFGWSWGSVHCPDAIDASAVMTALNTPVEWRAEARARAFHALGAYTPTPAIMAFQLAALRNEKDQPVVDALKYTVGSLDDRSLGPVFLLLRDPDSEVRLRARGALSSMLDPDPNVLDGDARAIAREFLADRKPTSVDQLLDIPRLDTILLLGRRRVACGDPRVQTLLEAEAKDLGNDLQQRAAIRALKDRDKYCKPP